MSLKTEARKVARELKGRGVPFILRNRLAKARVRGNSDRFLLRDIGQSLGAKGCECCDPTAREVFDVGGLLIVTEYGKVDRVYRPADADDRAQFIQYF